MIRKSHILVDEITDKEISILYAISKMTVIDEMTERGQYFNMEFVEFMEFICRVADFLYNPMGLEAEFSSSSEDQSDEGLVGQ